MEVDFPSSTVECAVRRVAAQSEQWASLSAAEKIELVEQIMTNLIECCDEMQMFVVEKRDGSVGGDSAGQEKGCVEPQHEVARRAASMAVHWMHCTMVIICGFYVVFKERVKSVILRDPFRACLPLIILLTVEMP